MKKYFKSNSRNWNKLILLAIIVGLVVVSCKGQEDLSDKSFTCDLEIPYIILDSINIENGKAILILSDTFSVADWSFYEEVLFYLWDEGCFELDPENLAFSDSVLFIFNHDSRSIERGDIVGRITELVDLRNDIKIYNDFFQSNYLRPSFRQDLVLLSHIYGKVLDPQPKDGVVYNENFLGYLLQLGYNCQEGKVTNKDLEVLKKIISLVEREEGKEHIYNLLKNIFASCKAEKKQFNY